MAWFEIAGLPRVGRIEQDNQVLIRGAHDRLGCLIAIQVAENKIEDSQISGGKFSCLANRPIS